MSTRPSKKWSEQFQPDISLNEYFIGLVSETKLAVSYARVSTAQQIDGTSLELQEETNVALAESMGFDVPDDLRTCLRSLK